MATIVKVGTVPGRVESYALEDSPTVADAIEAAGLDASGYSVKVDNHSCGDDQILQDGQTVLLVKKVSAG